MLSSYREIKFFTYKQNIFLSCIEQYIMPIACWASLAILAAGMATLYTLDWYKNRKQIRKTKKLAIAEDYTTKEPAEQLA